MKPRTGLNRKVSSIFDGAPLPNPTAASGQAIGSSPNAAPVSDVTPETERAGKARLRTRYGDISQSIQHKLFMPKPGVSETRQKTTFMLMLVLAVVFVAVLWYSFNTGGAAAPVTKAVPVVVQNNTQSQQSDADTIAWTTPEPYPLNMTDPMAFGKNSGVVLLPDPNSPLPVVSLAVKGIVFSDDKPGAIVNGQVVYQGQEIDGAKVVKISRKTVEFTAEDKSWTQEVQR